MKANELRIGNLVFADFYGQKEILIESICNINKEIFNPTAGEIPFSSLKPIPLTEEWLVKLGFKYLNSKEYMKFNLFRTIVISADYSDNFSIAYLRINDTTIEFKYVHEIQNLHFALRKEELQITN